MQANMISVILPSYLGSYKNAAKDRDIKLKVAIESVVNQTYKEWELIIIADGCEKTVEIAQNYISDDRIKLFLIPKQTMFSGMVRNTGLSKAVGETICYLDSDDYFGKNHLQFIANNISDNKWIFFNDITFQKKQLLPRECTLYLGKCGTSNIAHRKDLPVTWDIKNNYGYDDWGFIRKLLMYKYKNVGCGEYFVSHIPIGKAAYDI